MSETQFKVHYVRRDLKNSTLNNIKILLRKMTLILVSGITKYNNEFSHLNESIFDKTLLSYVSETSSFPYSRTSDNNKIKTK